MSVTSPLPCPRCGQVVASDATHCGVCGQAQPDRDDPPEAWLGRLVDGKYAIEGVLGVGGMGMVFRARRVLVGDQVALKVLFPRFLESPLQRRLFEDEAIAAARLAHPNVVTVFDAEFSVETGVAYIAMELLEGRPLKQLLKERAPMPAGEVASIMAQVCDALAAAHTARIIHRDLKPDNVFLEDLPGGGVRVKLVDFGIAAMLDAAPKDDQNRLFGTLRYMAPEQCLGLPVDGRADLYALGVVLYEMLTRKRATGKTVTAVLKDAVVPPNDLLEEASRMPAELEALVLSLLAKKPDERPSDAAAVRDALVRVASAAGVPVGLAASRGSLPRSLPPRPRAPTLETVPTVPPTPRPAPAPAVASPQAAPKSATPGPNRRVLWLGVGFAVAAGLVLAVVFGLGSA
jgi:serine/threonine-protein kinase